MQCDYSLILKNLKSQMYTFIEKKILLVRVYSVFPVLEMGIRAHDFKISDVCQTIFDVKNDLRFYVEYIFLRFSTTFSLDSLPHFP